MADINHRIGIKKPASEVYKAISTINGIAGWWTRETSGESKVGGEITFLFKTPDGELKGRMEMKVTLLEPDQKVEWRVIDGPPEWIGTDIHFHLSQQGDDTILLFSHRNWKEVTEFTYHCSMKWAVFLLSLKDLVLNGKGRPSPEDLKIDNWN